MTAPASRTIRPAPHGPAHDRPSGLVLTVVATPQPPLAVPPVPLALVRPGITIPTPPHRPGPRPHDARRAGRAEVDFGPQQSTRTDLADPAPTARALFRLAVEVLGGRRPLVQLQSLTTPGVYASLSHRRRPEWCVHGTAPILLGPVHVCEPVDGVAEVSAVARRAGRAHALAARLEGLDGRWRCTALQIG